MNKIKLSQLVELKKGKKVNEVISFQKGANRYIQIEDLRNDLNLKYTRDEKVVMVNEKDILIAWDGANAGTIGFGLSGTIGSTIVAIKIKQKYSNQIIPQFLGLFLKGKSKYLREKATGATIPHIQKSVLMNLDIFLPSIRIQKKIVETLKLASELIEKRKEQLVEMDQLIQSVFYEMFGDIRKNEKMWEFVSLEKIAKVGSSKRVFVKELVDSGIPFYRGTEVGELATGNEVSPKLFITKEHYTRLKQLTDIPKKGDILLPSICPDGRIWLIDTDEPFYFKDGRVLWIHFVSSNINNTFVKYSLKERLVRDYTNIASGTTFAEIKIFSLKKVEIFLPPIDLQNKFASIVEEIEAQKKVMEESLHEMENNFNALMQKAFSGELFPE